MTNKLNLALVEDLESLASRMVIPNIEANEIADAPEISKGKSSLECL